MHGRLSAVLHDDSPLFAGIPREFQAVRYHSLCLEQPLPGELKPIAWTSDGVLMAVEHTGRSQWGVQFHPESICTEYGRRLLANFRDLTASNPRGRRRQRRRRAAGRATAGAGEQRSRRAAAEVEATRHPVRLRACLRAALRRERERLLARQQPDRRARPLLLHRRRGGPARRDDLLRDRRRRGADRARRRGRAAKRIDLRLPERRDAAPAAGLRGAALRLQLRLRRLLRL